MLSEIKNIPVLIRQYGFMRLSYRLYFDVIRKTGILKTRFPSNDWNFRNGQLNIIGDKYTKGLSLKVLIKELSSRFFFSAGKTDQPVNKNLKSAFDEIENLKQGKFLYFSCKYGQLGYPDTQWLYNPFTNKSFPNDIHWTKLSDFNKELGDIKYIWEPSRFCWVYSIARVYKVTKNEDYVEVFWNLLESWLESNPPNMGPNWQCGQETALRCFALIFALFAFLESSSTTELRLRKLLTLLTTSADRIEKHINYARIQMGNHAVSEAGALWTIGLLFPFLKNSERWKRVGKNILEDEIKKCNLQDGSYIQHSMNYQRLMLHIYLWCFRLAELNTVRFSSFTYERIKKSYLFLYNMQDADTGYTPNYGPNDGANIFPLTNCDYPDYRPLLQAFNYFYTGNRIYDDGPYDEMLLWFFGPDSSNAPVKRIVRESQDYSDGGYYTFRRKNSWGMVRCHTYHNRPNQADMLHFDLWWKGINILRDSGTYSYFDPVDNWNDFFVSTRAHNTVEIGNLNQMIKGTRFRWYSLLESRFYFHEMDKDFEIWQGEHNGYNRLASKSIHKRAIVNLLDDSWLIIDDIVGSGNETTRLILNLPDFNCEKNNDGVVINTPEGVVDIGIMSVFEYTKIQLHYGCVDGLRVGWNSLYYGTKKPSPVLLAESYSELPIRYITLVSLGKERLDFKYSNTKIQFKSVYRNCDVIVKLDDIKYSDHVVKEINIDGITVWKKH